MKLLTVNQRERDQYNYQSPDLYNGNMNNGDYEQQPARRLKKNAASAYLPT